MLTRGFNFALRLGPRCSTATQIITKNSYSTETAVVYDKDPAPYFFDDQIQQWLRKLTRPDPEIVFRRRLDGRKLKAPEYKFMTDDQLKEAMAEADRKMWELLQMPPVVKIREEEAHILSKDPELQGLMNYDLMITDTTFGVSNKNRIIAVREANGNLRLARHAERDRLNQIYFPMKDREIDMPRMFLDEHLKPILERKDYDFILNRACTQFDPDSIDYHRVTKITYEFISDKEDFEKLRSTRHYGPMVFYLAWSKNIDNLLKENIDKELLDDAVTVIKLYYKLNPSENTVIDDENDHVKVIQHFIKNEAGSKKNLDQALNVYLKKDFEKKKLQENLDRKKLGETNVDGKEE